MLNSRALLVCRQMKGMMQEIKANLYPCMHCQETGTCASGEGGTSCIACAKYHELKRTNVNNGPRFLSCDTI